MRKRRTYGAAEEKQLERAFLGKKGLLQVTKGAKQPASWSWDRCMLERRHC
jgi:hypothetical protein